MHELSSRDAVFVVTEEHCCPMYYDVGDEFTIEDLSVSVKRRERSRRICLIMAQKLAKVTTDLKSVQQGRFRTFKCGGCLGFIRFEHKINKPQMTECFRVSKKRSKNKIVDSFFGLFRRMEFFEPLEDFELCDIAFMMKTLNYPPKKSIIVSGVKGRFFYIVLSGKVAVVKNDNTIIAELGPGEIFGEMSLLSGNRAYPSVYSMTSTQLAALGAKDFKWLLLRFPLLKIFLYRLQLKRTQINTMLSGKIISGMSGELADINAVELFQVVNRCGKSGKVDLTLPDSSASVFFREGEIIYASYGELLAKEALFALLGNREGTFTYTGGLTEEQDNQLPLGEFFKLLLEGLRLLDKKLEDGKEE